MNKQSTTSVAVAIACLAATMVATDAGVGRAEVGRAHTLSSGPCRPADGASNLFRDYIVSIVTATSDSLLLATRTSLSLPAVADTAVAFVTDSTVCAHAAYAHAVAAHQDTTSPPPVYVLRIGSMRYFAFNGVRTGEFVTYFLFDSSFNLITSMMS